MSEMITFRLIEMYKSEIEEVNAAICNEHLWELGYCGDEPNPHTENIADLSDYVSVLEDMIAELQ